LGYFQRSKWTGGTRGTKAHEGQGFMETTRWKVLLIEDDPATRHLLSTFLISMGCLCVATSSEKALRIIEGKAFDAILIDLGCSMIPAEQLILGIENVSPDLERRVLTISSGTVDPESSGLVLLHPLVPHIPRNRLFEQLWSSLQSSFSLPRWRNAAVQGAETAGLIFDSFLQPLPAGVRASYASDRHLVYRHGKIVVDLLLKSLAGMERVALAGQLLHSDGLDNEASNLPIVLVGPGGDVAATTTNGLGEFALEFEFAEDADLKIRIGEKPSFLVPLVGMAWAKRRL
jgi:hypothetical protein